MVVKTKYVVFDFDGTLVDSKHVFISCFNLLAAKHGLQQIDEFNIQSLKDLSTLQRLKALRVPLYKLPLLTAQFLKLYRSSVQQLTLFTGIQQMLLQLLDDGYSIAILSSNSVEAITTFLHNNGLECITAVYSSNNVFGKDSGIKSFLKKYHLNSNNVIYVGDELRDIIACKKCGVQIIWVSWGFDSEAGIASCLPDYKAGEPGDIVRIVKGMI